MACESFHFGKPFSLDFQGVACARMSGSEWVKRVITGKGQERTLFVSHIFCPGTTKRNESEMKKVCFTGKKREGRGTGRKMEEVTSGIFY